MPIAPAPLPCSSGYYDGSGGALQMRDGVLHVIDATFLNNEAEKLGPDVGGGAIYLNGALDGVVVGSTFLDNSGSNSGAIGSLNSDLDVYNSAFEGNAALGFGANSDDSSKCSVVDKNNQHQIGSGGNAGAIGIDGGSDATHTFCGDTFKVEHERHGGPRRRARPHARRRQADDGHRPLPLRQQHRRQRRRRVLPQLDAHHHRVDLHRQRRTDGDRDHPGRRHDLRLHQRDVLRQPRDDGRRRHARALRRRTARCSTAPSPTTCATRPTCSRRPSSARPT